MSIVIIDSGTANLRSVQKAFQQLGSVAPITQNKSEIINAQGIILPGVGSFDSGINELRSKGLEEAIMQAVASGKPFLGICLGLQILFKESQEGREKGLGILEGSVAKFNFDNTLYSDLKVPHMGWNRIIKKKESPLLQGINNGDMFYFVHSYYVNPANQDIVLSATDYGLEFTSSIAKDNIFGTQFHPEKSGEKGLQILNNFIEICRRKS
jgi:imidazole glycerol-phosphate synthase subunit HisH